MDELDLKPAYRRSSSHRFAMPDEEEVYGLVNSLTLREFQVLELVMDGLSNREIGDKLSISPRTVEIHRSKALIKMGGISTANAICIFQRYFAGIENAGA